MPRDERRPTPEMPPQRIRRWLAAGRHTAREPSVLAHPPEKQIVPNLDPRRR